MKPAIVWVDVLLARWGRRAIRCESNALGYSSSSVLNQFEGGDGYETSIPHGVSDDDLDACDAAVMRLPLVQVACLVVVYQVGAGRSDRENAERAGITRKMLTQYVHDAQRKIALDISHKEYQNTRQSDNTENCLRENQPVTARA